MTTSNEESRPKRQFFSANSERHTTSNRNYGNERKQSQEHRSTNRSYNQQDSRRYYDKSQDYQASDKSYNRNWEDSSQGNIQGNQEGAPRKRRPRVGERTATQKRGPGVAMDGRNWGGQQQQRNTPYSMGPGGKKLKKKKPFKQIKYKENADPNAPIRLNKYLANAGVCSRREADEFIAAGVVKVNGEVVSELGTKITRSDEVMFHNQPINLESKVYVLLNKPKGFVTTTDDPENRKTVMELVKSACSERIYPVGRLDRATTGVLLLTNDGDLASKLTHPKYEKRKIYQVWLDKPVAMEHMQAIADGIELEDGEIHADAISYVTEEDLTQVGIEIHSGKNRVVRRIFEKLGYRVLKLDRVYFAGLTKKKLSRGKWRYLSEQEVNMLRMGAFD